MNTVSIYSGGLDSTVMLHYLKSIGHKQLAIVFNYGQTHKKEVEYAHRNCRKLGIQIFEVPLKLPYIGVPLMGSGEIPDGYYTDESMKRTVVPNRNAIFISIAWGVALNIHADTVAIAAHIGDHPIYADCRRDFLELLQKALSLGSKKLELSVPFVRMTKTEIVVMGYGLGVDFTDTWSCYKGKELHCGVCGTCTERREAFELAEIEDPTMYIKEIT